mmetsp:Transcript_97003/g.274079  ORF Transcript_97003/g.274079 Transcript_97003/m.274079 type:complete len:127 (+) Transcript_97003:92-472(+)
MRQTPKGAAAFGAMGARLSEISASALDQLSSVDEQLTSIEQRVKQIQDIVKKPQSKEELTSVKTELAQLESKAKQLETKGVDEVYTGELNSGKQVAKATKKDMLRRLEMLFTLVESIFADIKKFGV